MNREPEFFKNTKFLVDGLHYANHVNCNPAFDVRSYPDFDTIITPMAENCNRRLRKIGCSPLFMNAKNFCTLLLWWIWCYNREMIAN